MATENGLGLRIIGLCSHVKAPVQCTRPHIDKNRNDKDLVGGIWRRCGLTVIEPARRNDQHNSCLLQGIMDLYRSASTTLS